MVSIIGHRGLDSSRQDYFAESSREAFSDQLARGYGLEFDVRPTKDGELVVMHDRTLKRITGGTDTRSIADITLQEFLSIPVERGSFMPFSELLSLLSHYRDDRISALHIKSEVQKPAILSKIHAILSHFQLDSLILFDLTIESAGLFKTWGSRYSLAPSLAHPYDVERYNSAVGGTLYTLEQILSHRELFDWVWLDEWDRTDVNGQTKQWYSKELFHTLRQEGLHIALVTPELHANSPGLLGGEAHPDARSLEALMMRCEEIISLIPDALCTDYPDLIRNLL